MRECSIGYRSQYQEMILEDLQVEGEIPLWLSGAFVSNGPGQFEIDGTPFQHWFDGFAMLKKFEFYAGRVRFQNQFLHSVEYVESCRRNRLINNEFATYASSSYWGRIQTSLMALLGRDARDNCVVSTIDFGDRYLALTETPNVIAFSLEDLTTQGSFQWEDSLRGQLTTAHPQVDGKTNEYMNVLIEIGRRIQYHIYTTDRRKNKRQLIQTYCSERLFYMHSFAVTSTYVILFKSPLVVNKYTLMLGLPFNQTLSYQEKSSSSFVIVHRETGKIVEIETEPFVCLHSVNAYEQDHDIILDLVCHRLGNPYDQLFLNNLRHRHPKLPEGVLTRYQLELDSGRCSSTLYSERGVEFPRIREQGHNGYAYQFAYVAAMSDQDAPFLNVIQKIDMHTGGCTRFHRVQDYVGEAVFVGKPGGQMEDEGVLLSIALNPSTQRSSLLILDAMTMMLLAEIYLPIYLPFGLHGRFYPS